MAEIFTVETKGIGKPDYSKEVSSSLERRGLRLAYKQTLMIAGRIFSAIVSPYAWVTAVLAPGATVSLIDNATGLPLPYTIPQGYTLSLIAGGAAVTEDAIMWVYFDGFLVLSGGVLAGGNPTYENRILAITTATIDPTGATAHTIDVQITNLGVGNLEGGVEWTGILEAVGTPPLPTTKTVHCKWCGHEEDVPKETTHVTCPNCGKLFIVYDLTKIRRTS